MSNPHAAISDLWQASISHTESLKRLDDEMSSRWMATVRGEFASTHPTQLVSMAGAVRSAETKLRDAVATAQAAGISMTVIQAIIANPMAGTKEKELSHA